MNVNAFAMDPSIVATHSFAIFVLTFPRLDLVQYPILFAILPFVPMDHHVPVVYLDISKILVWPWKDWWW